MGRPNIGKFLVPGQETGGNMRLGVALLGVSTIGVNAAALEVSVLSGRPDMVTGGNALIAVAGETQGPLRIRLNGKDVTRALRPGSTPGLFLARLSGLRQGNNRLEASNGGQAVHLDLVNHPVTGPVFSGPHQQPFICQTDQAGLGKPLDDACSAETRTRYYYRTKETVDPAQRRRSRTGLPPGFKALDPAAPRPSDVRTTTTSAGRTVPYIVRVETGTINRAIYEIAFLHDPQGDPPDPWNAPSEWNGRLVYGFGGGCRSGYRQGLTRSALQNSAVGKGYAVAVSSQNVFGNNCNDVISAETMMMVKEHFIESYGVPVHTIGVGGSGGSMQQHLIAQNYPGLLDAIIPGASYPDPTTLAHPVTDCSLLARAFENSSHEWTDQQRTAVSGYAAWATCESWMRSYSPSLITPQSCAPAVPGESVYDPEGNPDGTRCGFFDNMVNLVGRDPSTGFARRALDNVGVQYGLEAFNDGLISAEQFVDLNENVGGFDADANLVPQRSSSSIEALRVLYRTGRVNSGGGSLGSIPIVDTRRFQDPSGNIHDRVRTFVMDARLRAAHGSAANRVILTNPPPSLDAVSLVDRWLDAIAADRNGGASAETIARNRPAELDSACWSSDGERHADDPSRAASGYCGTMYAPSGDPRIAAGAPIAGDILKCQLKPVGADDYSRHLRPELLGRLRAIFPEGVCDYSRPGVGQEPLGGTWLSY